MFLLILESLGSAELLFILAMALVFFGPRKLPQLSRSLGKGLAEFRKASEDFKTTWAREVNLEEANFLDSNTYNPPNDLPKENSILADENQGEPLQLPSIDAVSPERVVAREPKKPADVISTENEFEEVSGQPEPSRKSDWL